MMISISLLFISICWMYRLKKDKKAGVVNTWDASIGKGIWWKVYKKNNKSDFYWFYYINWIVGLILFLLGAVGIIKILINVIVFKIFY